jgi:hypothetical protein
MVEDRTTHGKRIAQLLASELSGRDRGPLAAVSVVDADPDAQPAEGGVVAYGVAVDGARIGSIWLYPEAAECELDLAGADAVREAVRGADLTVVQPDPAAETEVTVRIESGAAVKRAVDALVAGIEATD